MKKIYIILSILLIIPSFAILSERKISLKEAIELSLKTNPQIEMARLDVEIANNNIKKANRLQNPSIYTYQNMGKATEENPQQIGANYVIELLKRGNRKKYSQSKAKEVYENQQEAKQILILEVRRTYIDLLLKKSNLKILTQQEELSKELLAHIEKEVKNKKSLKTDLIQAKIEYNRSVMYKNIASSEVIFAQNRFNTVMNIKDIDYDTKEDCLSDNYNSLLTINPENNKISFEKIKNFAMNNRYDLLLAKQGIESAKINLNIAKNKLIPNLELTGGYGYQLASTSSSGKYLSGAFAGVALTDIPIAYRYKPEIENAKLEIEKAQLKYNDTEIDAIRNITDAWEKYVIAKDTLNFYNEELLYNSDELIKESLNSLNKKEITLTDFLVSKKNHLELKLAYNNALADYYVSYAELLKEINGLEIKENELVLL